MVRFAWVSESKAPKCVSGVLTLLNPQTIFSPTKSHSSGVEAVPLAAQTASAATRLGDSAFAFEVLLGFFEENQDLLGVEGVL